MKSAVSSFLAMADPVELHPDHCVDLFGERRMGVLYSCHGTRGR